MVPVKLTNKKTQKSKLIWALLDGCSDKDIFEEEIASDLGIQTTEHSVSMTTVEGKVNVVKYLGDLSISSMDESYDCDINDAIFAPFPKARNDIPPIRRDLSKFPHLASVEFPDIEGDKISGIISAAHQSSWLGGKVIRGPKGQPMAYQTAFGWTLSGCTGKKPINEAASNKISVDDLGLKESMSKIFYNDFTVVSDEQIGDSVEAREAHQQLKDSVRFDDDEGKYRSGLTWKGGRTKAAEKLNSVDSSAMSMKRLMSLKRSMQRDPDKKTKAFAEVRKFIDNKRAEIVDPKTIQSKPKDRVQWTLPGHLVYQNEKWRFCHDGRASIDGVCLNDELIGALNLLTPLLDPIMNLREWIHALTTDIEAFFHNILVDALDQDAFLFFWFLDEDMTKVILIRFLAHIFGAASSSAITSYVLRYHAERIKSIFGQEVYEVIKRYFYVDDGTAGAHTEDAVKQLKKDLEEAMNIGGFKLAKWKSNSPSLLDLPSIADDERFTKVLGIGWDLLEDKIFVAVDDKLGLRPAETPRDVVTITAGIFDPLGIVAPAVHCDPELGR